tara:strand:- start:3098 stop:4042 length:945 start_codon:yes stop_codon:yes gene_type:complete
MSNKILIGGNIKNKDLPPTSTNFYGLSTKSNNLRIRAGMAPQKSNSLLVETYFHPNQENKIFNFAGSQKISIAQSGTGLGKKGGFISLNEPFSNNYYTKFDDNNVGVILGIIDEKSPDLSLVSDDVWNKRGRYLISKTIPEMNLPDVINWNQLKSLTIQWIAGNNENGGDRPDVFEVRDGVTAPNGNGLDGMIPPIRQSENLFVQFLDKDFNSLGKINLWIPKPYPTVEQIEITLDQTILPFFSAYSAGAGNLATPFIYPNNNFTTTTINIAESGINLTNVEYFAIRQFGSDDVLDNYGIKYVNLDFSVFRREN